MKRILFALSILCSSLISFGQVPEGFNYQAIIRDGSGVIKANQAVVIDIAILKGSISGNQIFLETHNVTTNEFGLINIVVGSKNTAGFSSIDWSLGPFFMKVTVDGFEMGTSEILSVPFALRAKTVENGFNGDYNNLINKPDFTSWDDNVLDDFSGNYEDLTNAPLIAPINDLSITETSLWSSQKTSGILDTKANITDVYSKTNLQTSNQAQVNYNNLTNKPTYLDEDKTNDVTLTGNQIISGNKSFNGSIVVPTPVNPSEAVNKSYVDALIDRIEALEQLLNVFIDARDNKIYKQVKIGNQIWMAENLAYLPEVNPPSSMLFDTPLYYVYGYSGTDVSEARNTSNYHTLGVLYNWPAAMNGQSSSEINPSGVQGACPCGWHMPSNAEWQELELFLGMSPEEINNGFWRGTDEGGKLKESGLDHWQDPNTGATNSSAFSAIPSGELYNDHNYTGLGAQGVYWSATQDNYNTNNSIGRLLRYNEQRIYANGYEKRLAFSVRCVKD